MNARPKFDELNAFATIVAHRSFRKAADELGVAPSTLSHLMRSLERNVGVRLLHRTTRSVSPTQAGEQLVVRLRPLIEGFDRVLDEASALGARPSGTLRLNASEPAARFLMQTIVKSFLARYPDVALDIVTEGRLVDIVATSFDAGVRLGDAVPRDMVAVRISAPVRFLAVASPAYLATRTLPRTPDDLQGHTCIKIRFPSGKPYSRWDFAKRGMEQSVEVSGPLTLDNLALIVEVAVDGMGIAYVPDHMAEPFLASGKLVALLEDWCPTMPGMHIYYPGHRHVPPALKAFVDMLKDSLAR